MTIHSLSFIFLFLPLAALAYYLAPQRARAGVLFVASVGFCALVQPLDTLVMLASVYADFLLARPVFAGGRGDRRARACLLFSVAKDILMFVAFSSLDQLSIKAMPLGVAVYSFTSLGYMVDLYNGETDLVTSPMEYGVFCCFFGKLSVGPIVSCGSLVPQLRGVVFSPEKVSEGADWFVRGLAKYVILAEGVSALARQLSELPYADKTVLSVWMLVVCTVFRTYFTLSGFSDMARGLGGIFGLSLPENFHYPLQAESVTDFFSRFNISANRFVRKYVYAALGAEDNGKLSTTLNIMLITMLMGIWYGVSINLLAWGASLGVLIVLETLFERFFERLPALVKRLYTFVAVVFSFSWYCGSSPGQSLFYLRTMVGAGDAAASNAVCLWLITSNWLLLLCCVVMCTNLVNLVARYTELRWPAAAHVLGAAADLALLALAVSFLV